MAGTMRMRAAAVLALIAAVSALTAPGGLAQESQGATVTVGGGSNGVESGHVVVVAPGVTIDAGDVTNDTGIGVIIGGGSSAGTTDGGDANASVGQ